MKALLRKILNSQQIGLIIVIVILSVILTIFAGSHTDRLTGRTVNNFFNRYTLVQTAIDASFFAIMAIGITMVIISGGIDLSVGSIYAFCGVLTAMALRSLNNLSPPLLFIFGLFLCLFLGLVCGFLNGFMITKLKVHPFIITLGTMWIFRGIAFVVSKAESILLPDVFMVFAKAKIVSSEVYLVPVLVLVAITIVGAFYLSRTVMGRYIYAVGGNIEASRYAGLKINPILISVYTISGLTAGIAAFMGSGYYGSASCADATGYELYVIASAVVGGASLSGGKGSAINAVLGAVLITLIRQSIRTLRFDQNYEWIIIGCAIIVAVVFDRMNIELSHRRLLNEANRNKQ
jgi:ribose transport system permease protein